MNFMLFEWQCCFLHCWYGNLHQHAMIHLKCTVTGHSRWNAQTGDWNRCGWLVKVSVQKAIGLVQVSAFRWSCDRSFFFHGTCDMWHVTEKSGCELIALWDRSCSANVRFTRKMSEWAAEMAVFPIQNYCTSLIIFVYTPFNDLPWLAEICYGVLSVFKDFSICLSDASTPYIHVHPLKVLQ